MKGGCSGCLGTLVALGVAALIVGGLVGATIRMITPPSGGDPVTTAADGTRAQRKLFDLARESRRGETITLTEGELNALLARHLVDARGLRMGGLSARLVGGDRLELHGRSSVGAILEEASLGAAAAVLPASWQARPVRLHVGARVRIDAGPPRQLRMDVDEFAVGRQRLPVFTLRLLVDPATVSLLRWRLPDHVEQVSVEPGRVIIRTAS
jgi:hypothetical protein